MSEAPNATDVDEGEGDGEGELEDVPSNATVSFQGHSGMSLPTAVCSCVATLM